MASQSAHAGGNVVIGDRTLFVRVLGLREENALRLELSRRAKPAYGPGGLFQKMAPYTDWLKEQKRAAEFSIVIGRITEVAMFDEPLTDAAIEGFRMTPEGVAAEIYFRTRQTHAELSEADIRAVVTTANAVELHLAILGAITPPEREPGKE